MPGTTDIVLDADEEWDPEELPPVTVRIDGTEYTAHAPKDGVALLINRLREKAQEDVAAQEELMRQMLRSIFSTLDAEHLLSRVMDMDDEKVTLAYLMHVLGLVQRHYEPMMATQFEEVGLAARKVKTPQDRKPSARKKTAGRAAARKAVVRGR